MPSTTDGFARGHVAFRTVSERIDAPVPDRANRTAIPTAPWSADRRKISDLRNGYRFQQQPRDNLSSIHHIEERSVFGRGGRNRRRLRRGVDDTTAHEQNLTTKRRRQDCSIFRHSRGEFFRRPAATGDQHPSSSDSIHDPRSLPPTPASPTRPVRFPRCTTRHRLLLSANPTSRCPDGSRRRNERSSRDDRENI